MVWQGKEFLFYDFFHDPTYYNIQCYSPKLFCKYFVFEQVVQGAAQDKDEDQSWTPVVVRILEATSSQTEKILFLQDAAIYRCSSHTNILSLVGRSLESVPFLLLQEYCPQVSSRFKDTRHLKSSHIY